MPVENPSEEYQRWKMTWRKCRDAVEGEDQVKASNVIYLPMLSGMDKNEYDAYKNRATFYAATERTVKGLTGAIMRKLPNVTFPESKKDLLETIGADDEALDSIAQEVLEEVMTTGRPGVYLDAPDEGSDNPYVCVYYAENIINWRSQRIGGKNVLTLVVVRESYEEIDPDDEFASAKKDRYRVLKLDIADPQNQLFTVEVWEEEKKTEEDDTELAFVKVANITPTMKGGRTLNYIPFIFITPTGNTADVEKPPLLDLVNLNLSHYRSSADYEHGLHFTALPTAWVAGFGEKGDNLKIGSAVAWTSEDPNAKAGYLEFSGEGLGAIAQSLESKEQKMAVLGARLLEDQKNAAEAAATVSMRHAGERSVLANISNAVSDGLTQILRWVADWIGVSAPDKTSNDDSISYVLNQDFTDMVIDPLMFQAMMAALQSGQISWDVWFYFLQKGNVYPDNWSEETEREKIALGGPVSPMIPSGKPNPALPMNPKQVRTPGEKQPVAPLPTRPIIAPNPGQRGNGPAQPQSGQGANNRYVQPQITGNLPE